jgi:hypothetical protein
MMISIRRVFCRALIVTCLGMVADLQAQSDRIAPAPPSNQIVSHQRLTDADLRFIGAQQILAIKCLSCHRVGGTASNFAPYLESDFAWVDAGFVVPGRAQDSILYKYLKGSGFTQAPFGSMPQVGALSSSELAILRGWIDQMPPPTPTPSPTPVPTTSATPSETPVPLSRFEKAQRVLQANCLGCHSGGSWGWEKLTSDQAWINSELVVAGSMAASKLTLRLKFGKQDNALSTEDMPSPKGTKIWNDFNSTDYAAIRDWVLNMQTSPAGPGSEVVPTAGSIYRGSTDFIRLGDRFFVESVLKDIYGPSVATITTPLIFTRLSFLGGPCDLKERSTSIVNSRLAINYLSCQGADLLDDHATLLPQSSSLRAGLITKACLSINALDSAVLYAAQAAGAGSTLAWPSSSQIANAYKLFYPGRTLRTDSEAALNAVVNGAKTNFPSAPIEGWRYLLLSVCNTPEWQQP